MDGHSAAKFEGRSEVFPVPPLLLRKQGRSAACPVCAGRCHRTQKKYSKRTHFSALALSKTRFPSNKRTQTNPSPATLAYMNQPSIPGRGVDWTSPTDTSPRATRWQPCVKQHLPLSLARRPPSSRGGALAHAGFAYAAPRGPRAPNHIDNRAGLRTRVRKVALAVLYQKGRANAHGELDRSDLRVLAAEDPDIVAQAADGLFDHGFTVITIASKSLARASHLVEADVRQPADDSFPSGEVDASYLRPSHPAKGRSVDGHAADLSLISEPPRRQGRGLNRSLSFRMSFHFSYRPAEQVCLTCSDIRCPHRPLCGLGLASWLSATGVMTAIHLTQTGCLTDNNRGAALCPAWARGRSFPQRKAC